MPWFKREARLAHTQMGPTFRPQFLGGVREAPMAPFFTSLYDSIGGGG